MNKLNIHSINNYGDLGRMLVMHYASYGRMLNAKMAEMILDFEKELGGCEKFSSKIYSKKLHLQNKIFLDDIDKIFDEYMISISLLVSKHYK